MEPLIRTILSLSRKRTARRRKKKKSKTLSLPKTDRISWKTLKTRIRSKIMSKNSEIAKKMRSLLWKKNRAEILDSLNNKVEN